MALCKGHEALWLSPALLDLGHRRRQVQGLRQTHPPQLHLGALESVGFTRFVYILNTYLDTCAKIRAAAANYKNNKAKADADGM